MAQSEGAVHKASGSNWRGPGAADGEVVCGIGSDCVIFPNSTNVVSNVPQPQSNEIVQYTFPEQDFLDIQVTEEEVISETWDNGQPVEEVSQHFVELKVACNPTTEPDEVEIPLPQDQDAYTTMRPYPCDFCSRRFRKKANLMNHMVAHQTDRPHGCNLCGARYRRKCDLINHMKIHAYAPGHLGSDDEDDDVPSNNLNENDNVTSIKGRRKKTQSAAPKKRKTLVTSTQSNSYLEEDDNSLSCKDFKRSNYSNTSSRKKYSSGSYSYVDEDMKLLSQPPPTFTPSMEPQEPAVPRWPVIDESRPYVCQHCGVGFAREKALGSHARIHAGDSPFECNTCGEMFWDVGLLKEHARTKHVGKSREESDASGPYTGDDRFGEFHCETCGLGFHRQDLLKRHRRHMVSHRDKAVSCEECGLEFPDGRALINHRHSHNKEPSARQFSCAECGKTFGSRSSQQIHARIHTGERPYGCRFCWKAFADGGTLRKHERIHTGEKPYACAVCPRAFNQRVVLREHIRSHHSGPEPRSSSSHAPVYVCKVCAAAFSSSEQLCAHLIQHSDENTAKQRMPKLGPRKYKRRRKLNPHELTLLSNVATTTRGDTSADGDPDSDDDGSSYRRKIAKKKFKQKGKSNTDENFESVVKSFESVIENFNSIVSHSKSEPGKEKIEKKKHKVKRKSTLDGKYSGNSGLNNKSRTNVPDLSSGGFVKSTRPAGESRIRPRTKNVTVSTLAVLKAVASKPRPETKVGRDVSRAGPRTKNVNYHNVKMAKLPAATFPATKSKVAKNVTDSKLSTKRENNKTVSSEENHSVSVKSESDRNNPVPSKVLEDEKEVKVEFTCEMCSETFTKRSELLVHVPIHI
ncbi:zinc finger protein 135-like isoform X2 [Periplaneta americana]|uniref:zinc finger protein 135-like isoform X2 n=1 Tax=Periplaneta americana TaxID=6978 RepID=UPI0037E75782